MSQMRRRREANPRRVGTEAKKKFDHFVTASIKTRDISCYWAANISLSQNWMSILTSSTMMETLIRFTLCNSETAGFHTEGLCLFGVGERECVALQEGAREGTMVQRGG